MAEPKPSRARALVADAWESVTENAGLKASSLLIAMALYGVVRGAGTVERGLEVSLLVRPPASDVRRVLMTDLPDRVRVVVKGPPTLVNAIRPESIGGAEVNISDGRVAVARVDPATMQLPAGVSILSVQPSSLQLSWEDLVERDVPVRVETVGRTAPGTRPAAIIEAIPQRVHVTGPALYVDGLSAVRTEAIDVTGLEAGQHTRRVALELPRSRVHYVGATSVRVAITVERDLTERRLDHLDITVVGSQRVQLRPAAVSIRVRGLAGPVSAMDPALIVPTVDVSEELVSRREAVRLPVRAGHMPAGVELVDIEPPEVIATPR
ncbi:MAG: CdaR family protein [Polyangiales bacterium]